MRPCHQCQKLFIQALYDELAPQLKKWFEDHISQCPDCQKEYTELQVTSHFMGQKEAPQPDEEFWKSIWNQVETQLQDSQTQSFWTKGTQIFNKVADTLTGFKLPKYASVLGIFLVGILIGRFFLQPQSGGVDIPDIVSSHNQFISAPLDSRSIQYLERSKMLLLSFNNFDFEVDGIDALNLSAQKSISQQLIKETEYLQTRSETPSNKRFLQLMQDLESVLLQIANLESSKDIEGVQIQMIQEGVEKQGLLFKINLMEIARGDTTQSLQSNHNDLNI